MRANKRRRLEARGWKVGTAEEFLGLTPEEAALVEIRLKLADAHDAGAALGRGGG